MLRILSGWYLSDNFKPMESTISNGKPHDKIINKKNDYTKGVYNGSILTIKIENSFVDYYIFNYKNMVILINIFRKIYFIMLIRIY